MFCCSIFCEDGLGMKWKEMWGVLVFLLVLFVLLVFVRRYFFVCFILILVFCGFIIGYFVFFISSISWLFFFVFYVYVISDSFVVSSLIGEWGVLFIMFWFVKFMFGVIFWMGDVVGFVEMI